MTCSYQLIVSGIQNGTMKAEMINEGTITESDKLLQSSLEPRAAAALPPTQTPGKHLSHRKQGSDFSTIRIGQEDQAQKHGSGARMEALWLSPGMCTRCSLRQVCCINNTMVNSDQQNDKTTVGGTTFMGHCHREVLRG